MKKYGNRNVAKMIRQVDTLRAAIHAHDVEATEAAWDKVEEHIDFAYRADVDALVKENEELKVEVEFFKSEVKLRNRIPATTDPLAELLRRAEAAEAKLKAVESAVNNVLFEHKKAIEDNRLFDGSEVYVAEQIHDNLTEVIRKITKGNEDE